ncbi:MAG: iron(III) transport system permease protein [Frankiales bacterium]|nr:iron(III) transport system permease protein [Frankiales bacterium]
MPAPAGSSARGVATGVVGVIVAALVGVPLFRLAQVLWQARTGSLRDSLGSAGLRAALLNTIVLALAVTIAGVAIGVAMALVLRRPGLPGRPFWRAAVLLPVLVPDFVLGYSWTAAYSRGGVSDSALGLSWAGLLGPAGVWLVLVVNAAPLAYLVVASALAARAEPALEQAARSSGASATTALFTITLRLALPAVAAAAVLVFVLSLGAFAIPQVLGAPAGFATVTTRIYADLSVGGAESSFVEAVALALLLVVVTVVCIAPADALLGRRLRSDRLTSTDEETGAAPRRWVDRGLAAGLATYLLLSVGLPLGALVLSSLTRAVGVPATPGNWTVAHYREVLTPRTGAALGRSLGLAVAAASLLTILGGLVGALERRRSGRLAATLITLTLVLPGSTLAVALSITYGRWLSGTLLLILLGYLAKLWAFAHRPIAGALDRLPPDELRAARASGATALTALRTVVLPPLSPALLAAWMICFLTALHEVTMSSVLYGPGSETLAVVVLNSAELGRPGPTAALSVVVCLVVAVPVLTLWLGLALTRARRPGRAPVPAPALELLHVP